MTRPEFIDWMQGHMAVFALVQAHYDKLTDDQKQAMETAWYGVLRNVEVRDAVDATNRMVGDPKLQPSGGAKEDRIPRHITKVRDISEESRKRRQYGQWTDEEGGVRKIVCLRCMDTTWISIWVTEQGDLGESGVTTCPHCDLGQAALKKLAPKGYRDRLGQHREWTEGVLVPGKTQKEQRVAMARIENERAWEIIFKRQGHRRKRVWTPSASRPRIDQEVPSDSEEGFRHISEVIPF